LLGQIEQSHKSIHPTTDPKSQVLQTKWPVALSLALSHSVVLYFLPRARRNMLSDARSRAHARIISWGIHKLSVVHLKRF